MFFWFLGASVVSVFVVFRTPALDYRLVMVGSLLGLLEWPFGAGPLHSIVFSALALGLVMVLTIGRRLRRRQAIGLAIGMFLHQVLDGSWTLQERFWWPLAGGRPFTTPVPEAGRPLVNLVLELLGVSLLLWAFGRFGLDDDARRTRFMRTGQLDRTIANNAPEG